jgi:hypothetical protein
MRVVVAEKPSVARDLAKVLGASQRRDGYLEGNGWQVTWAIGHLVQLKTPDEYDPALKRWSMDRLPFVPERFELRPTDNQGAHHQLEVVAGLCRTADELVCATDAGREGELIFRYILDYAGCAARPHTRLWLSSLTEEAIKQAFANRKPGERLRQPARRGASAQRSGLDRRPQRDPRLHGAVRRRWRVVEPRAGADAGAGADRAARRRDPGLRPAAVLGAAHALPHGAVPLRRRTLPRTGAGAGPACPGHRAAARSNGSSAVPSRCRRRCSTT